MNSFPLFTRFSGGDNGGHINSQKDILFLGSWSLNHVILYDMWHDLEPSRERLAAALVTNEEKSASDLSKKNERARI